MDEGLRSQSVWSRARNDTIRATRSLRVQITLVVVSASSGATAHTLAPDSWSDDVAVWFAAALAISAALSVVAAFYLVAFVLAPYRLLNEARSDLGELDDESQRLQVVVGSWGRLAVGGDFQGKVWVWFISATITNPSESLPIGTSGVWLEVAQGERRWKIRPISSTQRDGMKSYMGLPIPQRDLSDTLYLEPLQSERGEYQFLEHIPETTAKSFVVTDSKGNTYQRSLTDNHLP